MGMDHWIRLAETDANTARFIQLLPVLVPAHQGQSVLMRHREPVGFFPSIIDAHIAGTTRFKDGAFSVQRISPAPDDPEDPAFGEPAAS